MKEDCTKHLLEWLTSNDAKKYRKAIKCLYEEMYHKIIGMIINKGGTKEIAEEIYWDGILEVDRWAKLRKFEPNSNVPGFLKTVCERAWLKMVKRDRNLKLNDLPLNLEQLLKEKEVINEWLLSEEIRRVLDKQIDLFGEKCKKILSLYYWRGYSLEEIAERLNFASANVVKVSKSRCLKKLRKAIEKLGGMDLFRRE